MTNSERLGDFLKAKRNSIRPETIGLNKPYRSRTPGLRREDVAERANISTVWYSKLERGKAERVSRQVLLAVSHALCCDDSETKYLLQLAGLGGLPAKSSQSYTVSASSVRLLDNLNPLPAAFVNEYKDILRVNHAFNLMLGFDMNSIDLSERNAILLASHHPQWRRWMNINSDDDLLYCMKRSSASLRAAMGNRGGEAEWQSKLDHLLASSEPFRQAWGCLSVKEITEIENTYQHASIGALRLRKQFWFSQSGEGFGHLMVYLPLNDDDEQRLVKLIHEVN